MSRGILPIAFGAAVYGIYVPGDVTAILLFPLSMLLAVVVSFACRFILNLSAFWLIEIRGLVYALRARVRPAGRPPDPGAAVPDWLRHVAYATPFPALVQTPIDLVTGQATGARAVGLVGAQVAWAVVMLLAGRVVLARATRKLVVQGG